jgi:replicative DNA helicase
MKRSAPIYRLKRRAKLLSRETNAPLHEALDQIARQEGYRSWGHLSQANSGHPPPKQILGNLASGDLVLLGARPGHGKTRLGLALALEAARAGRRSFFFSLVESEGGLIDHLPFLGAEGKAIRDRLVIDTSDDICASYIVDRVRYGSAGDSVVVVDYLQILDQRRSHPELAVQLETLGSLARDMPSVVVTISQIDRSFERKGRRLPELTDVRLPNPANLALFTKTCFMHEGQILIQAIS